MSSNASKSVDIQFNHSKCTLSLFVLLPWYHEYLQEQLQMRKSIFGSRNTDEFLQVCCSLWARSLGGGGAKEGKMERQSLNRVSGIWIPHPAQPLLPVVCQILANQRKPETSFNVPNMSNTWKKARFHVLCKCDALFSGYVRYFLQILLQLSFTLEFQYELHLLFQLWKDNARKKVSICSHIARAIYFETHSTQIQCTVNLKQSQEKHFLFYSYSLSNVISSIFSISYF